MGECPLPAEYWVFIFWNLFKFGAELTHSPPSIINSCPFSLYNRPIYEFHTPGGLYCEALNFDANFTLARFSVF